MIKETHLSVCPNTSLTKSCSSHICHNISQTVRQRPHSCFIVERVRRVLGWRWNIELHVCWRERPFEAVRDGACKQLKNEVAEGASYREELDSWADT
ncbi:hypothetical protein K443DRAFT_165671 [Laccaria amethystina LaAM-08-1]|jgi:hypothetical protein|uniref:Uncharacterized protein n=1 Tax=Laccaria amethystina LaAM-08-1 TaxID=1095629 RepID=A0A0C9XRE1_9AGAR|nr:hypothetical protein K443DRAFT_165671 [Laccaria amethystina LaAM-08-1]